MATLKDGEYIGNGKGNGGKLSVKVVVDQGLISSIDIVDSNETPGISDSCFQTIPDRIIESQSTDVDTVSGATKTSLGICQAVEDALK
ncbi:MULTISPECIES: FMN-binding protein [Aerococcus]|uniref:FMN-binding protein n=1 Tax=Aerococcus TaxID=1375 RepID=UPI000DCCA224|nr:FMN-binding protein [Aerococcus urinae]RAV94310.1 FMN-binding domain-containing protein [Aerococcus mictus]MDK6375296.1 FMN-binding protein [Aerococcus urinae]MDK6420144.1 FMN-binding protein [Aerococcus urinae]MDK8075637.1 FMN-binding protein [Aerococcus urinae]MDK8084594.1 FMN-binding protein [Aerococcus urinae]